MNCPTCGANNPDGYVACQNCGARNPAAPPFNPQQNYNPQQNQNPNQQYADVFVDNSEYLVATLANGFADNFVGGEGFKKEDAYVSNKRVYYNSRVGVLNVTNIRNIVDIPEVTGTKLVDIKHWGLLIFGILFVIAGVVISAVSDDEPSLSMLLPLIGFGIMLIISFFLSKKKHLRIEYAGGFLYFSVRKYRMQNVIAFQKAIYSEKDKLKRMG